MFLSFCNGGANSRRRATATSTCLHKVPVLYTEYKHNKRKCRTNFEFYSCSCSSYLVCGTMHCWTASHQLATVPTIISLGRRLSQGQCQDKFVYSTSRCRPSQRYWDAGHSTASLNRCFMVASFRERLDSKLAAHLYRGQMPAASWFQVDASERPFVIDPQLQRCFGILQWPKRTQVHPFPGTATPATSIQKFKNVIPETEIAYVIRSHTIV